MADSWDCSTRSPRTLNVARVTPSVDDRDVEEIHTSRRQIGVRVS